MQITLVSSGDTVFDVLDEFISLFCVNESELKSLTDSQYLALRSSIHELKEIADFLLNKFTVDLTAPKRNSKVSLAGWIAKVLLSAREVVQTLEVTNQITDVECPDCGFVHKPSKTPYALTVNLVHTLLKFWTQRKSLFTQFRLLLMAVLLLNQPIPFPKLIRILS